MNKTGFKTPQRGGKFGSLDKILSVSKTIHMTPQIITQHMK
jgi:hypothetical protein